MRAATIAVLALVASGCGKTTDATPRDVAMQFYVTLEAAGVRGIPEARAMPALEPYLTSELTTRLKEAAASADPQRSIFSGLYEGYSTYYVQDTRLLGDTALVIMGFSNMTQKPAVKWSDTLVVIKGPPSWRVADLRYGGNWDFGYRGTLTGVLTRAASSTSHDGTSATPPAPATNTR
ncbi:MAG: hypothetical protein IBJ03_11745 [Gemmatimonadaceae bacterium]|nr:hypothetical protein [Gemmatimonadaceae bacterium]